MQNVDTYCEFLGGDALREDAKTFPGLVLLQNQVYDLLLQPNRQVHLWHTATLKIGKMLRSLRHYTQE